MKLPRDVHGTEAVKALPRLGLVCLRQAGSHIIMRRESRTVVVPQHKPIKPGTLKGLTEQAGLSEEEFTAQLCPTASPALYSLAGTVNYFA